MADNPQTDFMLLDNPAILAFLFHPRPSYGPLDSSASAQQVLIPVADDVVIGGRFHMFEQKAPTILFFHGNGEIVDDYDELGPYYNRIGINFMAVDYRGYGQSTGTPTSSALLHDCRIILDFVRQWLQQNEYSGALILMGRSLGSASVLELVNQQPENIAGLIIESGFAYTGPLLRLIGIDTDRLGFTESQGFNNLEKIKSFDKPTLIIHAENDHIIPFSDGVALYEASPASDKFLLKIPYANHNNIMAFGLQAYMEAVKTFATKFE